MSKQEMIQEPLPGKQGEPKTFRELVHLRSDCGRLETKKGLSRGEKTAA